MESVAGTWKYYDKTCCWVRSDYTSVQEITQYKTRILMNIWPNPASDYINIDAGDLQIQDHHDITIIDLNGRELIRVPFR